MRTPPANSLVGFSNTSVEVRRSLGRIMTITRKGLTGLGHVPALIAVGYLALAVTALRMASHRGDISRAVPLSNLLAADEAYNSESSGAGALTFVFNMRDCRERRDAILGLPHPRLSNERDSAALGWPICTAEASHCGRRQGRYRKAIPLRCVLCT